MVYYGDMAESPKQAPLSVFLAATVVIFGLSLSAAESVGFVPYYVDGTEPTRSKIALNDLPELGEEIAFGTVIKNTGGDGMGDGGIGEAAVTPTRIRSATIDMDLPVQDSDTRDIDELTEMLKKGPVRYVDSARLGEDGNVLIFGHSSQLPIVNNRMYKAFNRVSELQEGDTIALEGGGKEFVYRVLSVKQVDVEEGIIDLGKEGRRLTLVTCDTLSGKSARFVVEAEFVGSYDL